MPAEAVMNPTVPPLADHELDARPLSSGRIVLAFLLAPWAAPGLIIAVATLYARSGPFNFDPGFVAGIGVLPAYGGLLLVGLALLYSLRKTHRLDLVRLTAYGALGGILFLLFFTSALAPFFGFASLAFRDMVLAIGWGAILGAAVSLTFGFVAGVPTRRASNC